MKQKLVALLFVLYSYNNQTAISASPQEEKTLTTETILKTQLENLLEELKADDFSKTIIKKYKLNPSFTKTTREEIRNICKELEIKEEWLYKIFDIESNGNPQAVNKISGATGLIQMMPSTAKALNTTTEALRKMSAEEQLPFVKEYILRIKRKKHFNEFLDLYLAVFYPYAINKPHTYILGSEVSENRASTIAKQNKGIDRKGNNDNLLSKQEIKDWVS